MVTFQSIFPAAYFGRWPHVHFQVYSSLAKAVGASGAARDLADRDAARAVRRGVRHGGLRAEPREPLADVDRAGQRVPRRRRARDPEGRGSGGERPHGDARRRSLSVGVRDSGGLSCTCLLTRSAFDSSSTRWPWRTSSRSGGGGAVPRVAAVAQRTARAARGRARRAAVRARRRRVLHRRRGGHRRARAPAAASTRTICRRGQAGERSACRHAARRRDPDDRAVRVAERRAAPARSASPSSRSLARGQDRGAVAHASRPGSSTRRCSPWRPTSATSSRDHRRRPVRARDSAGDPLARRRRPSRRASCGAPTCCCSTTATASATRRSTCAPGAGAGAAGSARRACPTLVQMVAGGAGVTLLPELAVADRGARAPSCAVRAFARASRSHDRARLAQALPARARAARIGCGDARRVPACARPASHGLATVVFASSAPTREATNTEPTCPRRRRSSARTKTSAKGSPPRRRQASSCARRSSTSAKGKHGARSTEQAIAIGLSKARRAGVESAGPEEGRDVGGDPQAAKKDSHAGRSLRGRSRPPGRSRGARKATKGMSTKPGSKKALSAHAKARPPRTKADRGECEEGGTHARPQQWENVHPAQRKEVTVRRGRCHAPFPERCPTVRSVRSCPTRSS